MTSFPRLRLTAAIVAGKVAGGISRALGAGGGTNVPGVVARRIDPDALRRMSAALPQGVVLVGGTNGKTTTTRMIAAMVGSDERRVLHNRSGANLVTGLTATALAGSSLFGRPRADLGLFETDEAALPRTIDETRPRLVVLHNLFRDQLDRYGEVDAIASQWRAALERLPADAVVLLNADDPAIARLGPGLTARVVYYGLEDSRHAVGEVAHMADSQFCRDCGCAYEYQAVFYAHMGHYVCPRCGWCRPAPDYRLERLELSGTSAARLYLRYPGGALEVLLPLPGLYNALNALAATAAALLLGVAPVRIRQTLEEFSAAFGRIERVDAAGRSLLLALIKNPVGASETVRMLVGDVASSQLQPEVFRTASTPASGAGLIMLIAINDKVADGTDVSWLWDADFERLSGHVACAIVSGTRAADMAVRLKYAGVEASRIVLEGRLPQALDAAFAVLPTGATLYVLPTYTAMLEFRAELARRGWVRPFWED